MREKRSTWAGAPLPRVFNPDDYLRTSDRRAFTAERNEGFDDVVIVDGTA